MRTSAKTVLLIRGPKKSDKTDKKLKVRFQEKEIRQTLLQCFRKHWRSVCLISLGYQQASYQENLISYLNLWGSQWREARNRGDLRLPVKNWFQGRGKEIQDWVWRYVSLYLIFELLSSQMLNIFLVYGWSDIPHKSQQNNVGLKLSEVWFKIWISSNLVRESLKLSNNWCHWDSF